MKFLHSLVLIVGLAVFVNAQSVLLTGTVYDSDGAVIPGIKVIAKDKSGKSYSAISSNDDNDDGVYTIFLPNGTYTLEFKASNFKDFKVKDYRIVNATKSKMFLDVVLNPKGEVMDGKGFF